MNWESILGIITHPAVVTVITAIAGFSIKGFVHYRKAFNELVDIPRAVLKARKATSPGGKSITDAEYAAIGKEIVEWLEASAPLIPMKKGKA